ncbi:hypothetical protein B9Z55_028721 [Caenorhabditis nigoni]|uniref:Uncharacterized protein n=1 Tax=Caenorhabditis nigoni TaxID=1611254 RepID=A0A2G5SAM9_9PELO|nr:hypothetical protein B9Z55_028721 [Caenorhabditis nigoni]
MLVYPSQQGGFPGRYWDPFPSQFASKRKEEDRVKDVAYMEKDPMWSTAPTPAAPLSDTSYASELRGTPTRSIIARRMLP